MSEETSSTPVTPAPDSRTGAGTSSRVRLPGWLLPLVIFLVALIVRAPGVGWGLKNELHSASYHPDEPLLFAVSRSIEPGQGKFTPSFYNYGTLYLTVLRVASDVSSTYGGGPVEGKGWSWSNPAKVDWDWVSRCHLVGRWLSVLFGSATVLLVCLIGRRAIGPLAGGAAGLVLAFAPAHVLHSRFQTVDVFATFLMVASLAVSLRLIDPLSGSKEIVTDGKPGKEWSVTKIALVAGALAGLAAGTKYTPGVALVGLWVVLGVQRPVGWIKATVVGSLAALASFVVSTPGVILESEKFLADFKFEALHTSTGHGLVFAGTAPGWLFHLSNLSRGLGLILLLLGFVGLIVGAIQRQKWTWVVLGLAVPYFLVIGRAEVKFLRYTLPLLPLLALGVGSIVQEGHRRGGVMRIAVVLAILGVGGLPQGGFRDTLELTRLMVGEDPRDATIKELRNEDTTVGIAVDPWYWSPPFFADAAELRSVPWELRREQLQTMSQPPVAFVLDPAGSPTAFDVRLITELKPERIVLGGFELLPRLRLQAMPSVPEAYRADREQTITFLKELEANYDRIKVIGASRFALEDLSAPGMYVEDFAPYVHPVMYLWKRKPSR